MREEKANLLSQCNLCVADSRCEIHIFELLMQDSECVVSETTSCAVVKNFFLFVLFFVLLFVLFC